MCDFGGRKDKVDKKLLLNKIIQHDACEENHCGK